MSNFNRKWKWEWIIFPNTFNFSIAISRQLAIILSHINKFQNDAWFAVDRPFSNEKKIHKIYSLGLQVFSGFILICSEFQRSSVCELRLPIDVQ